MLGDAAGFAGGDVGFANDIEQRSFAVIDVAHDGDDGRAQDHFLRLIVDVEFHLPLGRVNHTAAALAFLYFETKAVFGANFFGDQFVNRLVDVGEHAQLHQVEIGRAHV